MAQEPLVIGKLPSDPYNGKIGEPVVVTLDPSIGAANYVLQAVGLPPSEWLASPIWVIPTMALIDTTSSPTAELRNGIAVA